MDTFILSRRELYKLALMSLLSTALFGIIGLSIVLMMQWMTLQNYASDSAEKHGIAEIQGSRLGGIAIFVGIFTTIGFFWVTGSLGSDAFPSAGLIWPVWLGSFAIFSLGLMEDLRNNSLSPRFRLACKGLILILVFLLVPEFVPSSIGVSGVDWLLSFPLIGLLLCLFFSVGFINAVNTVDGANGLVPGIYAMAAYIYAGELPGIAHDAAFYTASLFVMFNVISGRLFLGDAGSYGIGAVIVLSSLGAYSLNLFSLSFLAVLYFYPCVDFSVSIARRLLKGASIMAPDNDHMHNRVNRFFQGVFKSKNTANSATGLSIAGATSGIALVGYLQQWWPLTSDTWLWVFFAQFLVYGIIFFTLGRQGLKQSAASTH